VNSERRDSDQRSFNTKIVGRMSNLLSEFQRLVWIEHADSICEAIARDAQVPALDECAPLASWQPVAGRTVRSH